MRMAGQDGDVAVLNRQRSRSLGACFHARFARPMADRHIRRREDGRWRDRGSSGQPAQTSECGSGEHDPNEHGDADGRLPDSRPVAMAWRSTMRTKSAGRVNARAQASMATPAESMPMIVSTTAPPS